MKSFEKLLDTVRKNNPNLISEEAAQEMLNDYNDGITQLQQDSFDSGKAAGFEEGYREGIEKQKAICKQEMDDLLAKCDEDATNKLESIIKTINDSHAEKLEQIYKLCCANMVPVSEVEAMDADHADKLQQATDALIADHADKLQIAAESVKKAMAKAANSRIKSLVNKYNNLVNESTEKIGTLTKKLKNEKSKKMNLLTESVEKYLNYALQNAIPTKQLVSEAKYNASQKAIEKITSILKINNILQESKEGIFTDYENRLADAKKAQDKLVSENVELKHKLEKEEAKLLLESKVAKCTPAEAMFLRSYFENAKNARVIEEQIEDARTAFKRIHTEKRNELISKMNRNSSSKPSSVVTESKENTVKKTVPEKKPASTEKPRTSTLSMNPFINAYSEMLKNN